MLMNGLMIHRFYALLLCIVCCAGFLPEKVVAQNTSNYKVRDISHLLTPVLYQNVNLMESTDTEIGLAKLMEQRSVQPVVFQFIFTSCANVCPVMSTILRAIQDDVLDQAQLVSISIDPEYDRPEQLREYSQRFNAQPHWRFFTGELNGIVSLQKRLNVYQSNKMRHQPVTFVAIKDRLFRIDGLLSRQHLLDELEKLTALS